MLFEATRECRHLQMSSSAYGSSLQYHLAALTPRRKRGLDLPADPTVEVYLELDPFTDGELQEHFPCFLCSIFDYMKCRR